MKAQKYKLGFGCLGNGITVWNSLKEVNGDYQRIAHISENGEIQWIHAVPLPEAAEIFEHARLYVQEKIQKRDTIIRGIVTHLRDRFPLPGGHYEHYKLNEVIDLLSKPLTITV